MVIDIKSRLGVSDEAIEEFCKRWKITELALFGSALRDDFRADSDIDLLVTFAEDAEWSLFDYVHIEQELTDKIGRKVDLTQKDGLVNPFRRHRILKEATVIYAA